MTGISLPYDKHRVIWFLLLLFSTFIFFAMPSRTSGQVSLEQIFQFVNSNLPRVSGQVIELHDQTAYVRLRQGTPPSPVQIHREQVQETETGVQTVKKFIGTATLQPAEDDLARMSISARLQDRIQRGDLVSSPPIRLFVTGSTPVAFSELSRRLSALPDIQNVRRGAPDNPPSSRVLELFLRVGPSSLELRKRGELGTIARREWEKSPPGEEIPPPRPTEKTETNFRFESIRELNRTVQSFDWVSLGNRNSIQITAIGTKGALGFARWDESEGRLRGLRWHTLNKQPDILQVSLFPSPRGGGQVIYALIVTRPDKQSTIFSRLLTFNPTTNSLQGLWSARNVWLSLVNGRVYGQEIGREDPLSNPPRPVSVKRNGWEWSRSSASTSIPRQTAPGGFTISNGHIYRINKSGYLEVFKEGRRLIRSSESYGASPLRIGKTKNPSKGEARRTRPVPPGMVIAGTSNHRVNVVLARNHEEGFLVEAAKSYPNSTLYVLSRRPRRFTPVWQSSKLPGYISHLSRGPGGIWVAVVVQQTGGDFLTSFLGGKTSSTVFYRLTGPLGQNRL